MRFILVVYKLNSSQMFSLKRTQKRALQIFLIFSYSYKIIRMRLKSLQDDIFKHNYLLILIKKISTHMLIDINR